MSWGWSEKRVGRDERCYITLWERKKHRLIYVWINWLLTLPLKHKLHLLLFWLFWVCDCVRVCVCVLCMHVCGCKFYKCYNLNSFCVVHTNGNKITLDKITFYSHKLTPFSLFILFLFQIFLLYNCKFLFFF